MSALNKKSFLTYLKEGGIYVVLLVLLAIIIFQDPTFLSLLNLSNILTQSSVRIIIALGVAGLIVTQGTDLSAGRQVGLAAVVAATLLQSMDNANKVFPEMATMPIALVILIVCAIGAVIGLINGLIIAYLNVTPFITTAPKPPAATWRRPKASAKMFLPKRVLFHNTQTNATAINA